MVEYVRVKEVEYVRRKQGEPTAEDIVGGFLLKQFQRKSSGKVLIGDRKLSYEKALDYFESGQMRREEYEELLSKRKRAEKSLTGIKEEASAQRILRKEGLIRNLFGEKLRELSDIDQQKLITACSTVEGFRKFLMPYFERRLKEDYPEDHFSSSDYKDTLINFSNGRSNLESLSNKIDTFRMVLVQHIDWDYGEKLRFQSDQNLKEQYQELYANGSVFSLSRFLKDLSNLNR